MNSILGELQYMGGLPFTVFMDRTKLLHKQNISDIELTAFWRRISIQRTKSTQHLNYVIVNGKKKMLNDEELEYMERTYGKQPRLSDCCGAREKNNICSDCKEYCTPIINYEFNEK